VPARGGGEPYQIFCCTCRRGQAPAAPGRGGGVEGRGGGAALAARLRHRRRWGPPGRAPGGKSGTERKAVPLLGPNADFANGPKRLATVRSVPKLTLRSFPEAYQRYSLLEYGGVRDT